MKRFLVRAQLRPDLECIRRYALLGLLDETIQADHELAWEIMAGDPNRKRDFVFRNVSRSPFKMEIVTPTVPSNHLPYWDLEVTEANLLLETGTVCEISTTAVLLRSAKPTTSKGRGKKHDLVSAAFYEYNEGRAGPELSHLTGPVTRQDVVEPSTLFWFWMAAERLGFELVNDDNDNALFRASISDASKDGSKCPKGIPSIRAIDVRARVKVINPIAFATMLANGIGSAKAYGYGMVRIT